MSQSHFQNAHHFQVNNGHFTNLNTTITLNKNAAVSTHLWPHVVDGAIFDSAARYAAGKCHPGTRQKIIKKVFSWINGHNLAEYILWCYGPAGAGKSALAHTLCELLKQSHRHRYGGSFFFSAGSTDRGNAHRLFTTLSYQLALHFPPMRDELNEALSRDPSLPTKSMEIQLRTLIVEPLIRCQTRPTERLVLIIDGLDECEDETGATQSNIVTLIAQSIVDHNLPLQVIIASRPEYWIRDAFDTPPLLSVSFRLSLQDDDDADKDIKTYLISGFEQIRVKNNRVMESVVLPWPAENIIDHFVYQASGQYIYASTVLKFVGRSSGRFNDPQHQLRIITSPGPLQASAFSELDRLYARILSVYPRWETMKRVIAGLLVEANITIIKVAFGINPNELRQVLDALSSLIDTVEPGPLEGFELTLESLFGCLQDGRDQIHFCHRSFKEFLEDRTRSGVFHIDLESDTVPQEIVNSFFGNIHRNLDQNYKVQPFRFLNMDFVTYHGVLQHVARRLCMRYCRVGMIVPLLDSMTARLNLFRPIGLRHMSSLFYFLYDTTQITVMLEHFGFAAYTPLPDLANEGAMSVDEFGAACENLENAVKLAHQKAFRGLSSCTDFNVTPALVYLTEYCHGHSRDGLFEELSTLRQHSYIVPLRLYYRPTDKGVLLSSYKNTTVLWDAIFESAEEPVWRTVGLWKDLRIFFAHQKLRSLNLSNTEPTTYHTLSRFFDARRVSDILVKEYFQNPQNLAMITTITDLSLWTRILRTKTKLYSKTKKTLVQPSQKFILSILCWLNRQLTNPETATLLHDHDPALQDGMSLAMRFIFEHGALPIFVKKRNHVHFVSHTAEEIARSIARSVQYDEAPSDTWGGTWKTSPWRLFHDEVFGTTPFGVEDRGTAVSIIDPSQWHPHLVSLLLKLFVKFLYCCLHPSEIADDPSEIPTDNNTEEDLIPYITQCLPYAYPTRENLEAIVAIAYLYPQVAHSWNPQDGFWGLFVEFLRQYTCSVYSPQEQALFVSTIHLLHTRS